MQKRILTVLFVLVYGQAALAQWSTFPYENNPICLAAGDQVTPAIVSDGAGGAIIVWQDSRSGNNDMYAQKIDAAGKAQWAANGVAICTAADEQAFQSIASDGAGGAIIAWADFRNGTDYDVYAQKINAAGVVQWASNGVAICTAANYQLVPAIMSDGAGGAVFAWHDGRNGNTNYDIYAQKINAAGVVQWATNGVAVCTAANNQFSTVIVSDGVGGAIISWCDKRSGTGFVPYAQRIDATGALQWTSNGIALSTIGSAQFDPAIVSDGAGGAIITWNDSRNGTSNNDIYAQRITPAGTVQWAANGVAICSAAGDQLYPTIASDLTGGAIMTWQDLRSGNNDIYAQKIDAAGKAQWVANGVPICTASSDQSFPAIVSDSAGGAIITWQDSRSGNYDIYSQSINAVGTTLWTVNGVAISTPAGDQMSPATVSNGAGGTIVTWQDSRNGNNDIYVQEVDRLGIFGVAKPSLASVRDIPGDQGGQVRLQWERSMYDQAEYNLVSYYSIWRGVPGTSALDGASINKPPDMRPDFTGEAFRIVDSPGGATTLWEWIANVPVHNFATYSFVAPTLSDSSAGGTPYYRFFVSAQGLQANMYWDSQVDSGYSVDNLRPATPLNAALDQIGSTKIRLHWNPDLSDPDVGGYWVYRSSTSGFPLVDSMRLVATRDTATIDSTIIANGRYYYRITTMDIHGNESVPTDQLHTPNVSSVDATSTAPKVFALFQNYPNPFNPSTTITYELREPSNVRMSVYDVLGREVAVPVNERENAGVHQVKFDASRLSSGVYWYQIQTGDLVARNRMLLLK